MRAATFEGSSSTARSNSVWTFFAQAHGAEESGAVGFLAVDAAEPEVIKRVGGTKWAHYEASPPLCVGYPVSRY